MTGKTEILSLLKVVKRLNADDPISGWETYKNALREEFTKQHDAIAQKSQQTILGYITSAFGGRSGISKKPKNVIDIIESVGNDQRREIMAHREKNKHLFLEMQKQQEEAIRKQLEENKSKNLKLMDYMMGAGQPAQPSKSETI